MEKQYLLYLLQQFESGRISGQEQSELDGWYISRTLSGKPLDDPKEYALMIERLDAAFPFAPAVQVKRVRLWPRIAAAASIILVLGAGILYFTSRNADPIVNEYTALKDVKPGSNKAFLVLGNGKRISLTDAANGDVAKEAGVVVTKTADGQLLYSVAGSDNNSSTPVYNTIQTPKGGQYQVRLPDGSNVWLNADSKIRFLSSLAAGLGRRVELSGEAYFEVAKDKSRPFVVASNGQEVKVLGTHFNVNTYADEPVVKTTLLEGSIKVYASGSSKLIVPGQQAALGINGLSVSKVDVDDVVAWKNGKFVFEQEDIKSVMRKLSRWYDVEVVFEGETNKTVTAQISRFDNISKILEKIKFTRAASFRVEGRRIVVMP